MANDIKPPLAEPVKVKKLHTNGEREAEDAVERYLNRFPDRKVEVHVKGKLAYVASVQPDPKPRRR